MGIRGSTADIAGVSFDSPPGPRGLPRYGCLNDLLRNPMRFWSRVANAYGGIARVPLKGKHVYLVSDPALIYELLITNRHRYRKNLRYKAAVDTFGDGMLLAEGAAWKRQRLMVQPSLKTDYLHDRVEMMAELTAGFLDEWRGVGATPRDVDHDFLMLAQRQAGHYLMGPGFARIETRFSAAALAIKDNWPLPPRNLLALHLRRGKGRQARLEAAVAEMDACIADYLAEHRETDFENCGVLELIVKSSRAQGDEYAARALRDQMLTLFFAGHETSARSLTWLHYLLGEHPAVGERLREEVSSVLGNRIPSADDLERLRYTERVINETLRLYSPIHSISRVALEDDALGGYAIPAGTMLYVSLFATHRLREHWPDPERFDPDRFLPERVARRPRFAFIPFAAGHRNCVGANMAMVELKLAVAQIAQRFVLRLAPGHRVEIAAGTTMHPRYGMQMSIHQA